LAAEAKLVKEAAPDTARKDRREIELSDDTIGLYHGARRVDSAGSAGFQPDSSME
jgi:hypothetical protein